MRKIKLGLLFISLVATTATKNSYGFSIRKPGSNTGLFDALNYVRVSDFVKLSPKQFFRLTGKEMTLPDKLSFLILKNRMKHALKKEPGITIKDFLSTGRSSIPHVLLWVLIGFVALILLLVLIFGKLD